MCGNGHRRNLFVSSCTHGFLNGRNRIRNNDNDNVLTPRIPVRPKRTYFDSRVCLNPKCGKLQFSSVRCIRGVRDLPLPYNGALDPSGPGP